MSCNKGPGYASPLDAMRNGPKEKLLYVVCVQPDQSNGKSDLLATVDVDPESPTYCQIIHRLRTGRPDDELHHSGWNVCSSCHDNVSCGLTRDKLILPALLSNRIFIVNTGKTPRSPFMHKVIEASEVNKVNCTAVHTSHCLADGNIMISAMGDLDGNPKSDYVLVDANTFTINGTWVKGKAARFNYDFWYQPYHDVMVSSEWGAPKIWKRGFHPEDDKLPDAYGKNLNFYSWSKKELIQTIDLGQDGVAPLEVRFLHNPKESQGYVGTAVGSSVFRFYKNEDDTWAADRVIKVPPKKVSGWLGPYLSGLISDILISLDDRFLYFSNWLHGDVRQYDITDRANPKLTGQVFLGGKVVSDSDVKILEDEELTAAPEPVFIKGKRFYGGPQMLQLSLDGKRLYVSTSLFSPWDKQFYPETIKEGGRIVKLDIDTVKGGMTLDKNFLVDFSEGVDGPLLPHEMRYPGGDCTSDIWLANE